MNILEALHTEEAKLERQLTAIGGAIEALSGAAKASVTHVNRHPKKVVKRTMSASVRARISAKAKARWAKIKAEQGKKAK
jgi:hypothetical protein